MPHNLGDLLARAGVGPRLALVDLRHSDAPVELSAGELERRLHAFARGLAARGVEAGARVGFLSDNRWEMLVGYLGTMLAGAVAVPINHKFPRATVEHILRDSEVELLFFDEERTGLVPEGAASVGFDPSGEFDDFLDFGDFEAFRPQRGDLAEILYTSGSTGLPKGVPLDHHGQLWAVSKYLEPFERDEAGAAVAGGASLIVAPLFHMNALFFSSVCLLNAITVVMQPRFDAARYIEAVGRYRCSRLSGVPTMFAMVGRLDVSQIPKDLSSVESVFVGSAPLSETVVAQIGALFPAAQISNGYGTTEAGPAVFGPHPEGKPRPMLSIGYPMDDVEWRLVGGATDSEGALELRTEALTRGYLNRPEADRERFADGWYKTNDVMRHDEDGFFYFVSRADDMFVCGGENIFPSEVEELVHRHPGVQQTLVVGAPDDLKGRVPVAFVVPRSQSSADSELEASIQSFCIENAPAYLHPRRVVFKDVLPVGGTHKIDRTMLEREAAELMVAEGRASAEE